MTPESWLAAALILVGAVFFLAGTLGVLRLPDVFTRLHALTKADNVGLGFVGLGLAVLSGDWTVAVKLLLIWILVLLSGAAAAHLIARSALRGGSKPWQR